MGKVCEEAKYYSYTLKKALFCSLEVHVCAHGMAKSLKKIPLHHSTAWSLLALFPGPKRRRRRKGLVSAVCGCALIDELMSGSSLEGKSIFKKPLNSELKGFLLQVNLQHKTLISKAFYFKSLLTKINLQH